MEAGEAGERYAGVRGISAASVRSGRPGGHCLTRFPAAPVEDVLDGRFEAPQ